MTTGQLDAQLQSLQPDPAVEAALEQFQGSHRERVDLILRGYGERPALGERAYVVTDGQLSYLPEFTTVSYAELRRRARGLAAAWAQDERHRVEPGDFVAILGFASVDYVTAILALAYAHGVAVPLQTTLAGVDLHGIFADTAPTAIVATVGDLAAAVELAESQATVRTVIAVDYDERITEHRERLRAARERLERGPSQADLVELADLVAAGDPARWQPPMSEEGRQRIVLLIHSSGSTGTPKGLTHTEEHVDHRLWGRTGAARPLVRLLFAPLNHGMGLATVTTTLTRGGTCYVTTRPDLSMLLEDFGLVRPTDIVFFPRVLEMIHRQFLAEVARRIRAGEEPDAARAATRQQMRPLLGDRVALAVVGSASTAPELTRFMQETFGLQLIDTYGSTEAGVVIAGGFVNRAAVTDYRLRDVPELGYYSTDRPYPRGEFCVKTPLSNPSYFKRPEATAALFDADGFLLTGDIMEQRGPDQLAFIDRRNDVLKLSQGEYVAVGNLATTFESASSLLEQVYLHGNSARSYLVAVIVPNLDVARAELGQEPDDSQLTALIRAELRRVAAGAGLRSFDTPREFIVEREPFSHENGLLSSAHKRLRPALHARYGRRLEQLYAAGEREEGEAILRLLDPDSGLSVLDRVCVALALSLGVEAVDPAVQLGFADLGGDSLGAISFATLLSDIFGVDLGVNAILSPAASTTSWARAIERVLDGDGDGAATGAAVASFAEIHGPAATTVAAAALELAHFLGEDAVREARSAAPPADDARVVLVTGATGFLGRFVCLEWLERLAGVDGGRVVCLVRASSQAAARQRLAEAFDSDPELQRRFFELADGHLDVVVGDIAEVRLGLTEETFARLADEVDRVVHVGALVNHVLGYQELFAPNVAGTAHVIGFALQGRRKPVDFVSSLAAAHLLEGRSTSEAAALLSHVPLSEAYGAGYAVSKWAAEHLLRRAALEHDLPVTIFRGDMMLAHRRYRGQINVPDMFSRLLLSLLSSGLAPGSFYRPDSHGGRARAHYDGLPVDFVAAAIVAIGCAAPPPGIRTLHVVNPHDDGLSLDTFVDWLTDAGHGLHRIEDYDGWLRQFAAALRALPEAQRKQSSLGLIASLADAAEAGPPADSAAFQAALLALPATPQIPHLNRGFLDKCVADLRLLGLVPVAIGQPALRPQSAAL